MKKKIFKYIKTILALTLIGSLTLPSYAAVNAADGSAFVTKAEFDAALSDFNARLTTFEAGINSKIDSQVSSYLDRNGIWNGKEQVRNPIFVKAKYGEREPGLMTWFWKDANFVNWEGDFLKFKSHADTQYFAKCVVDNLTKSGLCFVKADLWQWDHGVHERGFEEGSESNPARAKQWDLASNFGWQGNLSLGFYESTIDKVADEIRPNLKDTKGIITQPCLLSTSFARADINKHLNLEQHYQGLYMIASKVNQTTNFFVSKGKKLWVCGYAYGGGGRHTSTGGIWIEVTPRLTSGVPTGPWFDIEDVTVY